MKKFTKKLLSLMLAICVLCPITAVASEQSSKEEPIMRIGIISDLQATSATSEGMLAAERAFEYFKNRGVDTVLNVGDIADSNSATVYKAYTDKYAAILGETPHVSVPGNHDIWSQGSLEEFGKFFNAPNSHTVINGYHFITIGSEGSDTNGNYSKTAKDFAEAELAKAAADAQGAPIFVLTHQHISNTVYGSESWGNNFLWGIIDKYPNVIHFSGHSHFVLEDERSIWQGDFTAIGTSSLSYTELEYGKDNGSVPPNAHEAKQYLYLQIFEDRIEIDRIKAATGEKIKDTWTLQLPLSKDTFTYTDARKDARTAPYFEEGAKLSATLSGSDLLVKFPAAKHDDFVHSYQIQLFDGNGKSLKDILIFSEFYRGLENMPDETTYWLKGIVKEFESYTLKVFPIESWGKKGDPLVLDFVTIQGATVPSPVRGELFSLDFADGKASNTSSSSTATLSSGSTVFGISDGLDALISNGDSKLSVKVAAAYYTLIAKKFTLETAFSVDKFEGDQTLISCIDEGGMGLFVTADGKVAFRANLDKMDPIEISAPINTDTIHHVAAVANTDIITLYLDGVAAGSATITGSKISYNRNAAFNLGFSKVGSGAFYGKIFTASLSKNVSSADAIATLYQAGLNSRDPEILARIYSELRRMQLSRETSSNKVVNALLETYMAELSTLLTRYHLPASSVDTVLSARDIDNVIPSLGGTLFKGTATLAPTVSGLASGEKYDLLAGNLSASWTDGDYATLNGEPYVAGTPITTLGFNRLVVYNECVPTIVDFTTYSSYTAPVITGIEDGQNFNLYIDEPPVITWTPESATATLDGEAYTAGTRITTPGEHTFVLSDGVSEITLTFTIVDPRPVIFGLEDGKTYDLYKEDAPAISWTPESATATIDGEAYVAGTPITALGWHSFVLSDGVANYAFAFQIIDTRPVVSGIENGKTYDLRKEDAPAASWNFEGTATLDGEAYVAGTPITALGEHTLTITNGDDISFTISFTVVSQRKGDFDNDEEITVSDALAALRIAARLAETTEDSLAIGDIDADGAITVSDSLAILRVAAKMADTL